jgi:predicted GNAT superfamily acetyltransferase
LGRGQVARLKSAVSISNKSVADLPYTFFHRMTESRIAHEISIRHCATLAEFEECVRIEHSTWGEDIAVPSAMFVVAHHTGGQVIGAFSGSRMVGFTLALAAMRSGKPFLHSHMTAVLTEFRDSGVGRRLKLFQRQDALKRGIGLVEWTFDPLELRNAHFNLVRLGAISRRFIPNCYGVTKSPLHSGLPTDRLVAEWWLDSGRVRSILADDAIPLKASVERISVPGNIDQLRRNDQESAVHIQTRVREQFQNWFAKGYVATGVGVGGGANTDYILEPADAVSGLKFPEPEKD